jgi:hypothetical protein
MTDPRVFFAFLTDRLNVLEKKTSGNAKSALLADASKAALPVASLCNGHHGHDVIKYKSYQGYKAAKSALLAHASTAAFPVASLCAMGTGHDVKIFLGVESCQLFNAKSARPHISIRNNPVVYVQCE